MAFLDVQAEHPIRFVPVPSSRIRLFYAQAGALCHYLAYAETGRHRTALLATIERWTTGASPRPIDEALGLSADELGARAVAYARAAVMATGARR